MLQIFSRDRASLARVFFDICLDSKKVILVLSYAALRVLPEILRVIGEEQRRVLAEEYLVFAERQVGVRYVLGRGLKLGEVLSREEANSLQAVLSLSEAPRFRQSLEEDPEGGAILGLLGLRESELPGWSFWVRNSQLRIELAFKKKARAAEFVERNKQLRVARHLPSLGGSVRRGTPLEAPSAVVDYRL